MAVTIYRRFVPDGTQNTEIDNLDVIAFADAVEQGLGGFKPTYVEGPNETHHRGDDLQRYIEWLAKYCDTMHARGYHVAGFSFSTGNPGLPFPGDPNPDDLVHLVSSGWAGVDAVVWHCYWGNVGFTSYNALRWKAAHDFCTANGWVHPPFVIGECGRDAVEGGSSGWRASGTLQVQYMSELQAYGQIVAGAPYVIGATPFSSSPTNDWANFSIEGLPMIGIPGLGPHCVLDPSDYDKLWIANAPLVKQVDRVSALQIAGTGTVDEQTQNAMIQMEARQNQLLTDYIKAEAEGKWTGPGSVDGIYCALRGGLQSPDYTRVFPA